MLVLVRGFIPSCGPLAGQNLLQFTSYFKVNREKQAKPELADKWAEQHRESMSSENQAAQGY